MSHVVIDEELHRAVLAALAANGADKLIAIPGDRYQSGSSEIKNWISLAAAIAETELEMTLVVYAPCYRSKAGAGNAKAFACWR